MQRVYSDHLSQKDQNYKGVTVKFNRAVVKDCPKERIIASRRKKFAGLLFDDHMRKYHSGFADYKLMISTRLEKSA